jgi:hypothetical protein
MAKSNNVSLSLADVRETVGESVKRMQNEGEKLVVRLRKEAKELVTSAPRPAVPQAVSDLRGQAERLLKDLEDRRTQLVESLRARVRTLGDTVVKQLGLAEAQRVTELSREVTGLTLRLAEMDRQLQALVKKSEKKDKEKEKAA